MVLDVLDLPWDTESNPKMQDNRVDEDRPRIQVVDYLYKSPNASYTSLKDSVQVVIAGYVDGNDYSNPQYP